MNLLENV